MIFDFFNKYRKPKILKEHLTDFQNGFSEYERRAILISLLIIANSDGEFHSKESSYFEMISKQLGYKLEEDYIDEFFKIDREEVYQILKGLNRKQKEWYILTLFSMIHADGKPMDVEFKYAQPYLERMQITREVFEETIQSSKLWKGRRPEGYLG